MPDLTYHFTMKNVKENLNGEIIILLCKTTQHKCVNSKCDRGGHSLILTKVIFSFVYNQGNIFLLRLFSKQILLKKKFYAEKYSFKNY